MSHEEDMKKLVDTDLDKDEMWRAYKDRGMPYDDGDSTPLATAFGCVLALIVFYGMAWGIFSLFKWIYRLIFG